MVTLDSQRLITGTLLKPFHVGEAVEVLAAAFPVDEIADLVPTIECRTAHAESAKGLLLVDEHLFLTGREFGMVFVAPLAKRLFESADRSDYDGIFTLF